MEIARVFLENVSPLFVTKKKKSVFKNIVSRDADWLIAIKNVWIWFKEMEMLILSLHIVSMHWIIPWLHLIKKKKLDNFGFSWNCCR